MGILSHIDRGIRELINRVEALADFRDQGKVRGLRPGLPELLSETMGSIDLPQSLGAGRSHAMHF